MCLPTSNGVTPDAIRELVAAGFPGLLVPSTRATVPFMPPPKTAVVQRADNRQCWYSFDRVEWTQSTVDGVRALVSTWELAASLHFSLHPPAVATTPVATKVAKSLTALIARALPSGELDDVVTSGAAVDAFLQLEASSPQQRRHWQCALQSSGAGCRLDLLSWHADVVARLPSPATVVRLSSFVTTLCLCWRPLTGSVCSPASTLVAARSSRDARAASVAPAEHIKWKAELDDAAAHSPRSARTVTIKGDCDDFHEGCVVCTGNVHGEATLLPETQGVQLAWLRAVHDLGNSELSVAWRPRGLLIVRRGEPLHMLLQPNPSASSGLTGNAVCDNYEWTVIAQWRSNMLQVAMRRDIPRTAAASTRSHAEAESRCEWFLDSLDQRLGYCKGALEPSCVDDVSKLARYVFV